MARGVGIGQSREAKDWWAGLSAKDKTDFRDISRLPRQHHTTTFSDLTDSDQQEISNASENQRSRVASGKAFKSFVAA